MRYFLILLYALPVTLAYMYDTEQNVTELISALMSVVLLVFALTSLVSKIGSLFVKRALGLSAFTAFGIYFYTRLLSFYLQGTGFNQQFLFHFNLTTFVETSQTYSYLVMAFLAWMTAMLVTVWVYVSRATPNKYPGSGLAALLLLAIALEPELRQLSVTGFRMVLFPVNQTLDQVEWERFGLNKNALVKNTSIVPEPGKNLVVVFLEGLETIYTDEQLFPGLTPNINSFSQDGWHHSNMMQVKGSEWTMGGLVASLCGTPLVYETDLRGNTIMFTHFLDRAECLTDILQEAGYHQVFMGGASTNFAGKGNFLDKHGFDAVLGKEELRGDLKDPGYLGDWGLYDDSLFTLAVEKFKQLSAQPAPFNLTLLTVDTHAPTGDPSRSCPAYTAIDNAILQAVHCTDFLVGKFIRDLQALPSFEDTVVVLLSDHLALRNDAYVLFPDNYPRRLYFTVLNSDGEKPLDALASPTDIAPTILDLIGVEHSASFLAGDSLLVPSKNHGKASNQSTERLNAIRYINSNYLTPPEKPGQLLYSQDADKVADINFVHQIDAVEYTEYGLEFEVTGSDPHFVFPLSGPGSESIKITVEIDVPADTAINIYFTTPEQPNFSESYKVSHALTKGLNKAVMFVKNRSPIGPLRIDPGATPGHYAIHSMEIRSFE